MATPRARLAFTPTLLALLVACEHTRGEVEINWTIVDRAGAQVFPSGELPDLCDFTGLLAADDATPTPYTLAVQMRLCEPGCPAGCDDPSCQLERITYACDAARGFSSVDARTEVPYDFHVDLVANPDTGPDTDPDTGPDTGACGCTLTPPCALVPGPRTRTVEPGLVTDLQVYLLVLGLDDIAAASTSGRTRLDLATCCTPDPSCA